MKNLEELEEERVNTEKMASITFAMVVKKWYTNLNSMLIKGVGMVCAIGVKLVKVKKERRPISVGDNHIRLSSG